jgi:hypothetical protein
MGAEPRKDSDTEYGLLVALHRLGDVEMGAEPRKDSD